MRVNSYFFYSALLDPALAANISNVEVLINLPVKAVMQRCVMVGLPGVIAALTALGSMLVYH